MYYLIRSDHSITRKEAIEKASRLTGLFEDDYYMGICWQEPYGTTRYLPWDDMTGDELMSLFQQSHYGKK